MPWFFAPSLKLSESHRGDTDIGPPVLISASVNPQQESARVAAGERTRVHFSIAVRGQNRIHGASDNMDTTATG